MVRIAHDLAELMHRGMQLQQGLGLVQLDGFLNSLGIMETCVSLTVGRIGNDYIAMAVQELSAALG